MFKCIPHPHELDLNATTQFQLLLFVFWSSFYIFVSLKIGGDSEWCNRIVTLCHGSSATLLSLKFCNFKNINTHKVTWGHKFIMFSSWGYFTFDLIWCLLYMTEGPLMFCHHTVALAILTRYVCMGYSGNRFCAMMAALEGTNPFLQVRWFLKFHGYKETKLFTVIDVIYLTLFIVIRGVFGTFLVYQFLETDLANTEEKIMFISLYLVSLKFIWDMYIYICRKYGFKYIFW